MEETYTAVCNNAAGLESDLTAGKEYQMSDLDFGWVKIHDYDNNKTIITEWDRFSHIKKTPKNTSEKEIIICRDNHKTERQLTEGKEYEVLGYSDGFYSVIDDRGNCNGFFRGRFTKKEKEMNIISNAKTAIMSRGFVIGSVNSHGHFSMSNNPVFHGTMEQAKKEAARLANLDPSKMFVVMQFQAGFQASGIVEI